MKKIYRIFLMFIAVIMLTTAVEVTATVAGKESVAYAKTVSSKKYKITYNLNGGTNNKKNPKSYKKTTKTIKLAKPTKKGYTFKGWYLDKKFKKQIKQIKKGSTGKKTLYAKWTVNEYNIEFDGNGAKSGSTTKMSSLKYGKSYTLSGNGFKRPGYTFIGWNTALNGKGTSYQNASSIRNLSTKNGATIRLYAQWKEEVYKISYVLNGGTNSANNPGTYSSAKLVTFENPTKPYYVFVGWYDNPDFRGLTVNNTYDLTKDITLYAKWALGTYSIKYHGNGGTGTDSHLGNDFSMGGNAYIRPVFLYSDWFVRPGYAFKGYNSKADGSGTTYLPEESITIDVPDGTKSIDMYAQWQKLDNQTIYNSMMAMKAQYPDGKSWTNDNMYTSKGRLFLTEDYGITSSGGGCVAFAYILSDAAFHYTPHKRIFDTSGYTIKVGDILRINNDTHSVIVLSISDSTVTVAEGNYASQIKWGRTINLSTTKVDYVDTRW